LYQERPYDPIDIDCIERIDFWVVEDKPQSELDYEEFEVTLHNEQANQPRNEPRVVIYVNNNYFINFIDY